MAWIANTCKPDPNTWCWVSDGKSVWPAVADPTRAGGWGNGDTWEDFDREVRKWSPILLPDYVPMPELEFFCPECRDAHEFDLAGLALDVGMELTCPYSHAVWKLNFVQVKQPDAEDDTPKHLFARRQVRYGDYVTNVSDGVGIPVAEY